MKRYLATIASILSFSVASITLAQQAAPSADSSLPAPGTRGNADNIPFIGKRDPGGNPVRLARATGHVSNYDEAKVSAYTLPDPLVMVSGQRVASADMWLQMRRPELLEFYRTEIYGRVPA